MYRKTRAWLLPSRQRLAAGGALEVECGGGAASEWREVELELHFAASPTDVVGEVGACELLRPRRVCSCC